MISKIKFFSASLNFYPYVVILILIWSLSSNIFIFSAKAIQEAPPTMTKANSTSFKVIATKSTATPFTNVVSHKSSASSKSTATPFTNVVSHKSTSAASNVIATTYVAKLPQILLPSYTITNATDTLSEIILSSNNTLNYKGSYSQQSLSKTIRGTTHPPPA
jgi:hypothetical protein